MQLLLFARTLASFFCRFLRCLYGDDLFQLFYNVANCISGLSLESIR